jgi:hypothetical protein
MVQGKLPGPIVDLLRRGSPGTGPEELRAQGYAVAYRMAVAEGIIRDPRPTQTVADAFAITPRALQKWTVEQQRRGVTWKDLVPASLPKGQVADFLRAKMLEMGSQYMNQYMKKGRLATPRKRGER